MLEHLRTAQLTRVEIQGFRRHQDRIDVALTDPHGAPCRRFVIAGPNGSGKTSFLEAVLWALDRESWCYKRPTVWLQRRLHAFPGNVRVALTLTTETGSEVSVTRTLTRAHADWHLAVDGKRCTDDQLRPLLRTLSLAGVSPSWWMSSTVKRPPFWLGAMNRAWQALNGRGADGSRLRLDPDGTLVVYVEGRAAHVADPLSSSLQEWLTLFNAIAYVGNDVRILLLDAPVPNLDAANAAQLLPALEQAAPRAQIILATNAAAPWDQVYSYERLLLGSSGAE